MSDTAHSDWEKSQMGKEITLVMGQSPPSTTYNTKKNGLPFFQGKADFGIKYPIASVWCDAPQKIAERGSILFSVRAPVGEINVSKERSCIGRGLAAISTDKLSTEYLFYLLDHKKPIFQKLAQGSTFEAINGSELKETEIAVPPLKEQQKIAEILTSVDEVIENTQLQIDKLEDLKKATMNELLTKGIGHTELKETEIGRIPETWQIKNLGDISKISRGKFSHRPRNDPMFFGGTIPFIQTGDVPKKAFEVQNYTQTLNEKGLEVSKLFPKGILVMTIAANIGEIAVLGFDACFPDSLVSIDPNGEIDRIFLMLTIRSLKQKLETLAPKNAQSNLNLARLNFFPVPVPPLDEQRVIAKTVDAIECQRKVKEKQLALIQYIKKSLMQDLLTGKVRVTT